MALNEDEKTFRFDILKMIYYKSFVQKQKKKQKQNRKNECWKQQTRAGAAVITVTDNRNSEQE